MNHTKIVLDDYDILLGNAAYLLNQYLANTSYSEHFVLVDDNTVEHCLPLLQQKFETYQILQIPSGELHKNIETCQQLWTHLMNHQANRNALLINLGGGVIGDMGGFVASTFKRGFDFIQIPTTLLAQVDASIGGKLGIDFAGIKNSVGLFKNPKQVIIDPNFIKTLPNRQILSGYAEILKHALIADKDYWDRLYDLKPLELSVEVWNSIIIDSLNIKKEVVKADPFEKGIRKILNYGHTIGHAIESYSLDKDKDPLLHGEAVALGLWLEAFLSVRVGTLSMTEFADIEKLIHRLYLKYQFSDKILTDLLFYMKNDKKNTKKGNNFTLLQKIGKSKHNCIVDDERFIMEFNYLAK